MLERVGSSQDVPADGAMRVFEVAGTKVTVANVGGALHAFDDACTHRGCSLATGTLDGTQVVCPCHGSRFDVSSGAVVRGLATQGVRSRQVQATPEDLLIES